MSYWIEVHCDVRSEVRDPAVPNDGSTRGLCYELNNDNPAAMAISADRASRWAIKEARRRGYVKRTIEEDGHRYLGWVCPHCQKFPPQSA